MNIEKELKVLLTEQEYDLIDKHFIWGDEISQRNHYYVCRDSKLWSSIRVREIDGEFFLQVKMPVSEDGALFVKKEFEKKLDTLPKELTAGELKELTGADFSDAVYVGDLFTLRKTCVIGDCEVCLDKSEYLGKTDYEIELEYNGEHPAALVSELEAMGISFDSPPTGKYARFLQALTGKTE